MPRKLCSYGFCRLSGRRAEPLQFVCARPFPLLLGSARTHSSWSHSTIDFADDISLSESRGSKNNVPLHVSLDSHSEMATLIRHETANILAKQIKSYRAATGTGRRSAASSLPTSRSSQPSVSFQPNSSLSMSQSVEQTQRFSSTNGQVCSWPIVDRGLTLSRRAFPEVGGQPTSPDPKGTQLASYTSSVAKGLPNVLLTPSPGPTEQTAHGLSAHFASAYIRRAESAGRMYGRAVYAEVHVRFMVVSPVPPFSK